MADPQGYTRKQFAAAVKGKYPQYANVPDDQLIDAIVAKYPQYKSSIIDLSTLPPGEISTGPHGVDALKAFLYKARNAGVNNLDALGATAGGILGAPSGPLGAVGGATLGGGAGRALTQLIHTGQGRSMGSSSEAAKDIAIGGAEQGAMELAGLGIGRLGKAIKPAGRDALIAYATHSGELGPKLQKVLPDLDRAAATVGRPKSVSAFSKLIDITNQELNQEFNAALFPVAQQPIAAHSVANAIRQEITPNLANTAEGQAMQRYLKRRATEFESGNWTVGSLNRERELISKRLKAWHNAIESGQVAQARVQAHVAADTAAENALKDMLYNIADNSGVKPPGYFRALKQRQSALIDLADASKGAEEKLTKQSLESKGAPLSEKIHLRTYLHPQSGTPGGVAGIAPTTFSDPLVKADKRIAKAFPEGLSKAVRGVRTAAGTAISNPTIDALTLRILSGALTEPQEAPQ